MTTETEITTETESIHLNTDVHVVIPKLTHVTTATVEKEAIHATDGTITDLKTDQAKEEAIHPKEKIHTEVMGPVHREKIHTEVMNQLLKEEIHVRALNTQTMIPAEELVPIRLKGLRRMVIVQLMEEMRIAPVEIRLLKTQTETMLSHAETKIAQVQAERRPAQEEAHQPAETEIVNSSNSAG
ncbi:MAG: hypothetical protein K0S53_1511 [Bacteroidetes bacterium]|jgi:hypothetical protein|nr:hypothetical protein [Bacteroidota bacterium]